MDLSILEYLLSAGTPAEDCPPPREDDPSFDAPCNTCHSFEPCPHDLIEWAEEVSYVLA
jgi:hypothetical protein